MAVFTRVAPWLAFLLGTLVLGDRWASPFAAVATLLIIAWELARGARGLELILDGSSLAYFTLFSVLSFAMPHAWFLAYVAAGAQLFHAVVIAAFLAGGVPFTLPLARRSTPAEVADSPQFVRFNRALTLVWLTSFALVGAVMVALLMSGVRQTWLQIAIVVISIVVPTLVQDRMIKGAQPPAPAAA